MSSFKVQPLTGLLSKCLSDCGPEQDHHKEELNRKLKLGQMAKK